MNWIGERISVVDHSTKTTIVILPHKSAWAISLMGAWLAMWLTIGFTTLWYLFNFTLTQKESVIVTVFMIFWFYYAFRVSKSFLWLLKGKEKIKVDEIGVHIKKAIFNYGKSRVYYFENIKGLEFNLPKEKSFQTVWEASPWINGAERFQFEYFGKMARFGNKLNEKEAKLLSQVLEKRMRKFSKK
jgi:hypothetical protein